MMRHLSVAAVLAGLAVPTSAIVIRHDVADREYRADASAYPSLLLLYRTKEGFGDCIATLIAPQWAVTAAHCTDVAVLKDGMAKGGYALQAGGSSNAIVKVERPPAKAGQRPPDIALLRLAKPVSAVRPVQIYRFRDEVGRIVLFPGWGDPGNGVTGLAKGDGQFRVAENRVDSTEDGRILFTFDAPDSGRALAFEGISGPGDSGGPALVMTPKGWTTMGVSSGQRVTGGKEGAYGVVEVYVRISEYRDWIDATLAGN